MWCFSSFHIFRRTTRTLPPSPALCVMLLGPSGPYGQFAGHECGVALAKMSFADTDLDVMPDDAELNFGQRTELEGWVDKFANFKCYPVAGRLVPASKLPDPNHLPYMTREQLAKFDGTSETIPAGFAAAPCYIGAGSKVYDASFGGLTFYGPGGPYHKFAGKDASRALSKMSLDDADLAPNSTTDDLTDKERKVLADWIKKYEQKQYPVVGLLKAQ